MENDNELMLAFKDGDEDAFNILFTKHLQSVLNLVFRFVRDAGIAEDLAQEVFLRVYRSRQRYEPRAKFSTFLYRIATNISLNYIRDNRKKKMLRFSELKINDTSTEFAMQLVNQKVEEPSNKLEKQEFQQKIIDAVGQLPENQRVALYLSKYLDFSHHEISEVMNQSNAAVKSLLSRARENLRKLLVTVLEKSPE